MCIGFLFLGQIKFIEVVQDKDSNHHEYMRIKGVDQVKIGFSKSGVVQDQVNIITMALVLKESYSYHSKSRARRKASVQL